MQDGRTWRDLLREVISDVKERQRLVEILNVTSTTLMRWVNGESEPRPQNLRQLITALPEHRDELRTLLRGEKGAEHTVPSPIEDAIRTIPSEFYSQVLLNRATTTENLRFWSTCHLILQQAIGQLDPDRQGVSIWVVSCMPPSGPYGKVRSLRESVGIGTPPWLGNLEQKAMFLGAESLAGNVITQCRPGIIQDLNEEHPLMTYVRAPYEKSAAIYPILYAGRIAGILLISSAVSNYFVSEARTDLVQQYADLIALAFEPEQFYEPEQIALCVMPSQEIQKDYFANYRQRVAEKMMIAATSNHPISTLEADNIVWQELEEELLQIPLG